MPGPKASEASTMPEASQAPMFPSGLPSTSVGPPSADWSIFATTWGDPENGTYQRRPVVAFGSVEPIGNCWLEPGSSVSKIPVEVDSILSGWWTSLRVLTGLSSPSTKIDKEVTIVG